MRQPSAAAWGGPTRSPLIRESPRASRSASTPALQRRAADAPPRTSTHRATRLAAPPVEQVPTRPADAIAANATAADPITVSLIAASPIAASPIAARPIAGHALIAGPTVAGVPLLSPVARPTFAPVQRQAIAAPVAAPVAAPIAAPGSAAPIQRVGELGPPGARQNDGPGQDDGFFAGLGALPPALRLFVGSLMRAVRAGHLRIPADRLPTLGHLLQSLVEELAEPAAGGALGGPGGGAGGGGNALPAPAGGGGGDGGAPALALGPPIGAAPAADGPALGRPLISLAQLISVIVRQDVTPFLDGHDLLLAPDFLDRHPIIIVQRDGGRGAAAGDDFNPAPARPGVGAPPWFTTLEARITARGLAPATLHALAPVIGTHPAITAPQIDRALDIYVASGARTASVAAWIAGGLKPQAAPIAPVARAAAGVPQATLDALLGAGAHLAIGNAITARNAAYEPNPFVVAHARTLIAAGLTPADTRTLLLQLIVDTPRRATFDRGVRIAVAMRRAPVPVPFAQINAFFTLNPGVALAAANETPLINPGDPADGLVARRGVTAALLVQVLAALAPLGAVGRDDFLTRRFPATDGLTLPRLAARLTDHTAAAPAGQHLAIGAVPAEFDRLEQAIGQRLHQNRITPQAAASIRAAHRLLRGGTVDQFRAFMGDNAVRNLLNNGQATNPAWHLLLFARYHQAALPGGFAPRNIAVNHFGAPSTVVIDQWIIDHIRERHTFENFDIHNPAVINRAPVSTFFAPPVTDITLANEITHILGNAIVGNAAWDGTEINVGAVQLRIRPVFARGPDPVLTQYFYAVAAGIQVPQAVLHAINNHFPQL